MEKTGGDWKEKQVIQYYSSSDRKSTPEELQLAAIAVSLNVRLRSADMPIAMQERALRLARSLFDSGEEFWIVRNTLAGRIRILFCGFVFFSSIQNRGSFDLQRSTTALPSMNFSVYYTFRRLDTYQINRPFQANL
ncbi:hypothetical protein Ccrd_019497 [Cynara cardunculus var. scolymus]|uniref:Uncharacterized protein n=1 Tax=Cynara cardunculus var. scolymus TaxID=59895 RepID=A0A124SF62_CYNCS|nr:hypothetical protein Ccrd_019497 [Cynara cardunculus var. scolymus]